MPGTLYICPTPIGNLQDITYRVIDTLKNVDLIAAEDTRHSMKLITHFDIHTPLTSYHEHNKVEKAEVLVSKLLEGIDVAAKTGTTNNDYDRWLCGFTPYYTAATWYGYDYNETIKFSGSNPAGLIWIGVMSKVHEGLEGATFK